MNAESITIENAPTTAPSNQPEADPSWSLARRVAFRFLSVYFILLFFPWPLPPVLPVGGEWLNNFFTESIWAPVIRLVAKYILRLPNEVSSVQTDSGDRLFDYVQIFVCFCLSVIVCAIWSYVQRRKTSHEKLEAAFRIWLRYTLAVVMISYGTIKVVQLQFPTPGPTQLLRTYGESSPMSLLWTFMGFSKAYGFFGGLMEIIPALLLYFRRTALLGALMLIAVLSNVVMLNFCFDVPVKMYSLHLLIMASLIALPDLQRLWHFFLENAPTAAAAVRKPFEKRSHERARIVAKILFIGAALALEIQGVWQGANERGPLAKNPPHMGAYEVVSFTRNGVDVPPILTDSTRPRYVVLRRFQDKLATSVRMLGGQTKHYLAEIDTEKKSLALGTKEDEKPTEFVLTFTDADGVLETLEGTLEGAKVKFQLRKYQTHEFPLMNRGFHWVNEFPYNR